MKRSAPRPSSTAACSAKSSCRIRELAGSPSGPIEPPMKMSRPTVSRAWRASLTDVQLICFSSSPREGGGRLGGVRGEVVRLDQVGARVDEADVERDDGFGGAQVGLLGATKARDGARDE